MMNGVRRTFSSPLATRLAQARKAARRRRFIGSFDAEGPRGGCDRLQAILRRRNGEMGFLQDRRILVTGMLSNRSIAYGIARACHREGARLAFTYQGEGVRERVLDLAKE